MLNAVYFQPEDIISSISFFFSFIFISWRLITLQFCSISSISNGSVVPNAIRITWMECLNPSS